MNVQDLKPADVFRYFRGISEIPMVLTTLMASSSMLLISRHCMDFSNISLDELKA